MSENTLSYMIRGAIFEVYNSIGPGMLESVYEAALYYELKNIGLKVEQQLDMPLEYKGNYMDVAYRLDLLVEDKIIIEIKSVTELSPVHYKQLLTYLKLSNKKLGLLVNFNSANMRANIIRLVNNL